MDFDFLFQNNELQILKIILPYLPEAYQKHMIIYIKLQELNYILHFPYVPTAQSSTEENKHDLFSLIQEIEPYLSEDIKSTVNNLLEMFETLQMMMELSEE